MNAASRRAPQKSIEIILKCVDGHGRFSADFNGMQIVTASRQPICDAARVLHGVGYSDKTLIIARHDGADHEAMRVPLGAWRKLRVREDRNAPRFVRWEQFPTRRVKPPVSQTDLAAGRVAPDNGIEPSPLPGADAVTLRSRKQ